MFDFGTYLDLPLIWAAIIGFAIYTYVVLDGFDLGCGILFPFAPTDNCRDKIMMSIAPFWDGNETWLVLGGGGLLAAFPLVYSIVMPAFYIPIIIMLLSLIFRGVSFEFRFKASGKMKRLWEHCFHFGSLLAALCQGIILGAFIEGIKVQNNSFVGGPFDWLSTFSLFCGISLVASYALLGGTWLIMKSHGTTQQWAIQVSKYVGIYVLVFTGAISLFSPFINSFIFERWLNKDNILFIGWLPLLVIFCFYYLYKTINNAHEKKDYIPFLITIVIFTLFSTGLAFSIWPYILPYNIDVWQGAAASRSLSLLLVGAVIVVPMILAYTAYSYYIFRGKTDLEHY